MLKSKKGISLIILIIIVAIIATIGIGAYFIIQNNNETTDSNNSQNENTENNSKDKNTKSIEEYSWKDFVIEIDGNIIKMGEKISMLETMGFVSQSDVNYKKDLKKGLEINSIPFKYKEYKGYNTVFFGAHNSTDTTRPVSDCDLNEVLVDKKFYKNYDVVLPGGILLTETLNINDIIDVWGEYTDENGMGVYKWIDDNHDKVNIRTNDDGTISSVGYDL